MMAAPGDHDNVTMFLGEKLLSACIASIICETHPCASDSELEQLQSEYVSPETLRACAPRVIGGATSAAQLYFKAGAEWARVDSRFTIRQLGDTLDMARAVIRVVGERDAAAADPCSCDNDVSRMFVELQRSRMPFEVSEREVSGGAARGFVSELRIGGAAELVGEARTSKRAARMSLAELYWREAARMSLAELYWRKKSGKAE